ncbi:hypothetical protein ACFLZH_04610 [Patescibacteria group bacterium]
MDQIFGIFLYILAMLSDKADCPSFMMHEYTYTLPPGLEEMSDWNEDGYLYVQDNLDNSADISYLFGRDFQTEMNRIKENTAVPILDVVILDDGTHKFVLNNLSKYEPYKAIIFVPLEEGIVKMYMYNQGDSETHGVFEEQALELARSVAQGEKDETDDSDCGNPTLWDLVPKQHKQG